MNSTLSRLQQEISSALQQLDSTQTQLRPRSRLARWSIQQIVEHLLLTYSSTEAALDDRLAKGRATRAKPSIPQRLGQLTVIRLGYFPSGRKAPPLVIPSASPAPLSGEQLTLSATDRLLRLDQRCTDAAERFGLTEPCASHTALGPLNLDQWRKFHLIHGEHHLKQIAAIRKTHGV